jgi:hypothetical protein
LSVEDRLHFGLGSAVTANLEILWASGGRESLADV